MTTSIETTLLASVLMIADTAKQGSKDYQVVSTILAVPGLAAWWKDYKKNSAVREKQEIADGLAELAKLKKDRDAADVRIHQLQNRYAPLSAKKGPVAVAAKPEVEKAKPGRKPKAEAAKIETSVKRGGRVAKKIEVESKAVKNAKAPAKTLKGSVSAKSERTPSAKTPSARVRGKK